MFEWIFSVFLQIKTDTMIVTTENQAEIKLELFRFIDTLSDNKLLGFYKLFISKQQEQSADFWDLLTDWEKEDINAGIADLDNGRYKSMNQVLARYQ